MKYRKVPLTAELEAIRDKQGEAEARKAMGVYFMELIRCKGWQLVVELLRDYERQALQGLRTTKGDTDRLLGIIHAIEYIRSSLNSLVPVESQETVDWYDEGEEDYLHVTKEVETEWE